MMRRILIVIVTNLITVVLLLLGIEWGVRMAYPALKPIGTSAGLFENQVYGASRGLRPNAIGESNGAVFRVDGYGMLSYTRSFEPSKKSILFLGDSVTMGIGVAPDSTFAGLVSQRLDSVNVLNPSLIGYNAQDYLRLLRTLVGDDDQRAFFGVKRVLLFWCLNDIYNDSVQLEEPGSAMRRLGGAALPWLRRHAMSYQWVKALAVDRPAAYYLHDAALYGQDSKLLATSIDVLAQIYALCREEEVALDVILLPYAYQLRPGYPMDEPTPQMILRQQLAAEGIAVMDLLPGLKQSDPERLESLYLWGDGIHFAPFGHKQIAHLLDDLLKAQ